MLRFVSIDIYNLKVIATIVDTNSSTTNHSILILRIIWSKHFHVDIEDKVLFGDDGDGDDEVQEASQWKRPLSLADN